MSQDKRTEKPPTQRGGIGRYVGQGSSSKKDQVEIVRFTVPKRARVRRATKEDIQRLEARQQERIMAAGERVIVRGKIRGVLESAGSPVTTDLTDAELVQATREALAILESTLDSPKAHLAYVRSALSDISHVQP